MGQYLLIESRDPFDTNDVAYSYDLAHGLVKDGHHVTLFLVQNGVLPARKSGKSQPLAELGQAGGRILADDFSLRERGITRDRMVKGVEPANLEIVVDRLAEGVKTIWH